MHSEHAPATDAIDDALDALRCVKPGDPAHSAAAHAVRAALAAAPVIDDLMVECAAGGCAARVPLASALSVDRGQPLCFVRCSACVAKNTPVVMSNESADKFADVLALFQAIARGTRAVLALYPLTA